MVKPRKEIVMVNSFMLGAKVFNVEGREIASELFTNFLFTSSRRAFKRTFARANKWADEIIESMSYEVR